MECLTDYFHLMFDSRCWLFGLLHNKKRVINSHSDSGLVYQESGLLRWGLNTQRTRVYMKNPSQLKMENNRPDRTLPRQHLNWGNTHKQHLSMCDSGFAFIDVWIQYHIYRCVDVMILLYRTDSDRQEMITQWHLE